MRTCSTAYGAAGRVARAARGRRRRYEHKPQQVATVAALLLAGAVSGCSGPKAKQVTRISDNLLLYWDGNSQRVSAEWGGISFLVDTSCVAFEEREAVPRSPLLSRVGIHRSTRPILAADAIDVEGTLQLHVVWRQINGATTHTLSPQGVFDCQVSDLPPS